MWFRLAIYPGRADLVVAVNIYGDVFFKADDVGRFLGYGNPYQFGYRYAPMDLKTEIPKTYADRQPGKKRRIPCFTFRQMINIIELTKSHHGMEDTEDLVRLLMEGLVESDSQLLVQIDPRRATKLVVLDPSIEHKDKKTCRLQDWIQRYTHVFLRHYCAEFNTELTKIGELNEKTSDQLNGCSNGKPGESQPGKDQPGDEYDELIIDEDTEDQSMPTADDQPMNTIEDQTMNPTNDLPIKTVKDQPGDNQPGKDQPGDCQPGKDQPIDEYGELIIDEDTEDQPMNTIEDQSMNSTNDLPVSEIGRNFAETRYLPLPLSIEHCLDIEYVCGNNVVPDKIRLKVNNGYYNFEMKK